jgi:hypothetical protein
MLHTLHCIAWDIMGAVIAVVAISLTGAHAKKTCYKGYSTWQKKRN